MAGRKGGKTHSRHITVESTGKRVIEQSRIRLLCVGAFFALCFGAIGYRILEIAVTADPVEMPKVIAAEPEYEKEGFYGSKEQEFSVDSYIPLRGDIVDRNGVVLATSLSTASLFANGKQVNNPDEVVKKLTRIFPGLDTKTIRRKLEEKRSFIWVKRNLTPIEQHKVNNLGLPGLYFQPEAKRIYPYGKLFCHALGYVGLDNVGLAGVEKTFNKQLLDKEHSDKPLQLSFDMRVQNIVHEEMTKAVREYNAIGATGVVLDIKTGEVIALSNLPDFDPHQPGKVKDITRFNRATLGVYEMGSTFKTLTVAAALDYGTVGINDGYDATNPIKVSRFTISDTHPKNRWLSVSEIFSYSSNIGTVRMVMDLGTAKQQEFLRKLGMFKPVDLELPELGTPLAPNPWREINTMTISYGHGMAVSPMHLVRGIATLVGDGTLTRMTLLKDGNSQKKASPRVVSEKTVLAMRKLMRLVVEKGTGSKGEAAGYRVGGKTGTAEKVGGGRYSANAKLASFVSIFPSEDPKYLVLVMVDEPRGNKSTHGYATGGWISAPVVGRIISRLGPLYGIRPIFELPAAPAPLVADMQKKSIHAVSY